MVEIRIHGRGGQGGVTLAKLIAASRFLEGQSVQAFGLYAAERSGAPIEVGCDPSVTGVPVQRNAARLNTASDNSTRCNTSRHGNKITLRPTEEQGGFIDGMIESGDFANQSEVIRAAIRLLQEQRVESKLTQLRQLVREGEDSPIIDDWNAEGFVGRMREKHNV